MSLPRSSARSLLGLIALGWLSFSGCRPSDILNVPPPPGEFTSQGFSGATEAFQAFLGAQAGLFEALGGANPSLGGGLMYYGGILGDEFSYRGGALTSSEASVDARETTASAANNEFELSDLVAAAVLGARSSLTLAEADLQQYAATTYPSTIGEGYALMGYAELFMAEDFCAGVPLSQGVPGGGWKFGDPLTTDSLMAVAAAHFDSALAHANSNDTVTALASVGLGRVLLDQNQPAQAATAVANVPTGFVYDVQTAPQYGASENYNTNDISFYMYNYEFGSYFTVSDIEGGDGLNFVTASDPRLVVDTAVTIDGEYGYSDRIGLFPTRYTRSTANLIPLATGIEARLIEAEAALAANPADPTWLGKLNALRNSTCTGSTNATCAYGTGQVPTQPYGLLSLTDPGSDTARVSLLFRERAFWLFGAGSRLSDLRRLIRQYGRSANTVFPTGTYGAAMSGTGIQAFFPTYGTDVALSLPSQLGSSSGITTNPNYAGCLTPTTTA